MREIKFRARRIDNGRWVYGQYFVTPLTDENSGTTPDAGWFFLTGEQRHCIVQNCVAFVIDVNTLGQYTALNDKNGVEICEGDIIDGREVYWSTDWAMFAVKGSEGGALMRFASDFEVVGNIYQNPDLLK